MLLLPNRNQEFHLIDNEAAGLEAFSPVMGVNTHPHRCFSNLQVSFAVKADGIDDGEFFFCLRQNAPAYFKGHGFKTLILKRSDSQTFVVVSHESFKTHE